MGYDGKINEERVLIKHQEPGLTAAWLSEWNDWIGWEAAQARLSEEETPTRGGIVRASSCLAASMGGANLFPCICLDSRSAWQDTKGCQRPSSGWKVPPFVEGRDEEDFVGKKFSGCWSAALLQCHLRRATKPRCKGVWVPTQTLFCQPKHADSQKVLLLKTFFYAL